MPRTIDEGFRDFHIKLTPTETETESAKSHRASIETRLTNDFGLLRFFRIGSFGNGTSISSHSDVDYLASLSTGFNTSSSTYSLGKVRDSLDNRFPFTGVKVSCPAVVVPFGTRKSEIHEVVPGSYVEKRGSYMVYHIADSAGGWMKVSPEAHIDYVNSVHQKLSSKVKPLIRFVKAWKYFRDVPISSFYLEMRVAKYASEESAIVYDIDVCKFLKLLQSVRLASIQDPMGVSGYITACKTDALKEEALSKLDTAVTRAEKARSAALAGNISDAFEQWRLLYNYEFPTYYY